MSKTLIIHDSFKNALELVHYCYLNPSSTLLLTGESDVGKTTVIQESLNRLEKSDTVQTILSIHVPVPFNISALLSILLKKIGDSRYERGTPEQKKQRLIETMKYAGIKLLVIDDFQHILLGRRVVLEVIGMLKEILKNTDVSLVAVASPEIYILEDSLEEIVQRRLRLEELHYKSVEDVALFKSILDDIEKQLPFEKMSKLSDLSNEIFILTNGSFAKISTLIKRAAYLAKMNKKPNLSPLFLYYSSKEMFGIPSVNPLYQRLLNEKKQ